MTLKTFKEKSIIFAVGQDYFFPFGKYRMLAESPAIISDRLYVPLLALADELFYEYAFDSESLTFSQGSRLVRYFFKTGDMSISGDYAKLACTIEKINGEYFAFAEDAALIFSRSCFMDESGGFAAFSRSNIKDAGKLDGVNDFLLELKSFKPPEEKTDFYVSPEGSDKNPGSLALPFASLEKARQAARGITGDVTVWLRGGDYFLNNSFDLQKEDGGKGWGQVVYKAYENERPVINGGHEITGWEAYRDGIYRVKTDGREVKVMMENGVRAVSARFPSEGYARLIGNPGPKTYNTFIYDIDLPELKNPEDLRVLVWPGGNEGEWNWLTNDIGVKEIDQKNKTVVLDERTSYALGTGSRYYFHGAKELLDAPGEFYVDPLEGYLYYKPRNLPIENQKIVSAAVDNLINISDADNVRNIGFEGICFTTASQNAVYMENASHITLKDCEIFITGGHGVYINGSSNGNIITGCDIYDIGDTGVEIGGSFGLSGDNFGQRIVNNHLHCCGVMAGSGSGVVIWHSGENVVAHNQLRDMPRYAISMKSRPPATTIGQIHEGIVVTWDNIRDFTPNRANLILYNNMWDFNNDSQDSGGFESWGAGCLDKNMSNVVSGNWLHDFDILFSFGHGIYLDDQSDGFDVYGNIVSRVNYGGEGRVHGLIMAKGVNNDIINNIGADAVNSVCGLLTQEQDGDYNYDIGVCRNIFYEYGANFFSVFDEFRDSKYKFSDFNLFYNRDGKYTVSGIPCGGSLESWRRFHDGKYDRNTLTTDPLFLDPRGGDYRLRYDSPAYSLGIKDIVYGNIGLLPDFKFVKDEVIEHLYFTVNGKTLPGSNLVLKKGETAEIGVFGRTDESGFFVKLSPPTFEVSDPTVASIDADGRVIGHGSGVCVITAVPFPERMNPRRCLYVLVDDAMQGVEVLEDYTSSPIPGVLLIGSSIRLLPVVVTQNRRFDAWHDSLTKITFKTLNDCAKTDIFGNVTGLKEGAADIEVTLEREGVECRAKVSIKVESQRLKEVWIDGVTAGQIVGSELHPVVQGLMTDGTKADLSKAQVSLTVTGALSSEFIAAAKGKGEIEAEVSYNGFTARAKKEIFVAEKPRDAFTEIKATEAVMLNENIELKDDLLVPSYYEGSALFANIDFDRGAKSVIITYVESRTEHGPGSLELRGSDGSVIARLCYPRSREGKTVSTEIPLEMSISGIRDVYAVFSKYQAGTLKSFVFNRA